jgi:hypothetical protein
MRVALSLLAAALLFASPGYAADATCTASATEIAALKARVLELEAQLAGRAAPALASGSTAQTTASQAASATTASADAQFSVATPPSPAINPVTRKVVVVEEEAHSRTGCSLGLFKGVPYGKWREPFHWDSLDKGMSAAEVEQLLGVEHYNIGSSKRMVWQYGKCGKQTQGEVLIEDGKLLDWRKPTF